MLSRVVVKEMFKDRQSSEKENDWNFITEQEVILDCKQLQEKQGQREIEKVE